MATGDAILSPRTTRRLLDHLASDAAQTDRRSAVELVGRLSERERDVAVAVGHGQGNEEIARSLSVATVKTHLASAQAKLGVGNRVQVAVLAERAGLLSAPRRTSG